MNKSKYIILIVLTLGLTLVMSSCGILRYVYETQRDYFIPHHSLATNNEFMVAWNVSSIRASHNGRRPTLVGGAGIIVVDGSESDDLFSGSILGLNSATGEVVWQIPGAGSGGGQNIIQDNVLYRFTIGEAKIQSYNIEDGNLIWQTDLLSARSVVDIYIAEKKDLYLHI